MRKGKRVEHGSWEVDYAPYDIVVHKCSLCGYTIATHEDSDYCPNCGADMRPQEEIHYIPVPEWLKGEVEEWMNL